MPYPPLLSELEEKELVAGSIGSAILITVMSNVAKSNAPDKALMKTNALLYKSEILNATIKGINTTFLFVIALTVISLVLSFFLNDKKKNKALINNNNLDQEMAV